MHTDSCFRTKLAETGEQVPGSEQTNASH